MVMETYTGWIDAVGGAHQCTAGFAPWLASLLANNMSVSVYMGFGGTNFGFEGGADAHGSSLGAVTTSYDYNAPVTEAGGAGTVFAALRAVYEAAGQTPPPLPANASVAAFGPVPMTQCARLWDAVEAGGAFPPSIRLSAPSSMELLGQAYGWILYTVTVPAWAAPEPSGGGGGLLCIPQAQDRVLVYADGVWAGLFGWSEPGGGGPSCVQLPPPRSASAGRSESSPPPLANISVLVQNVGRCSGEVTDTSCALKGILGAVTLDGAVVAPPTSSEWMHTLLGMGSGSLPWGDVAPLSAALPWVDAAAPGGGCAAASVQSGAEGPVFWRGNASLPSDAPPAATYLQARSYPPHTPTPTHPPPRTPHPRR